MVFEHFERLEHRSEKILPLRRFYIRVIKFALLSLALVFFSLGVGMLGYMYFEGMSPVDAFLNSAMLMGGMGPVDALRTDGGKIFAGLYALYCGFILLVSIAIFMTPFFHRLIHHFHLEDTKDAS